MSAATRSGCCSARLSIVAAPMELPAATNLGSECASAMARASSAKRGHVICDMAQFAGGNGTVQQPIVKGDNFVSISSASPPSSTPSLMPVGNCDLRCWDPVRFSDGPELVRRAYMLEFQKAQKRNDLLVVEELAESPLLFAVPYQMLRLILRDRRHQLNLLRNLVYSFRESLLVDKSLELRVAQRGSGAGLQLVNQQGLDGSLGKSARSAGTGDLYETALLLLQNDDQQEQVVKWLDQHKEEMSEYVSDMEIALKVLEKATERGCVEADATRMKNKKGVDLGDSWDVDIDAKDAVKSGRPPLRKKKSKEPVWQLFSFKPSVAKGLKEFRFLATNLHMQHMYVSQRISKATTFSKGKARKSSRVTQKDIVYDTTTCGAPAAHVYGFKDGNGIRQLQNELKSFKMKSRTRSKRKSQNSALSERQEYLKSRLKSWTITKRLDVAWVQATTILVTTFCRKLDSILSLSDPTKISLILEQYYSCGFLISFESLLSTAGKESGMLGDMDAAVKKLREMRFRIIVEDEDTEEQDMDTPAGDLGSGEAESKATTPLREPKAHHSRVKYEAGIRLTAGSVQRKGRGVSEVVFNVHVLRRGASLPAVVDDGASVIQVVPILFSQGVNERQTAANLGLIGNTSLQAQINTESVGVLRKYFTSHQNFMKRHSSTSRRANHLISKSLSQADYAPKELELLLHRLVARVQQGAKIASKNIQILLLAQELTRAINAGRVTVCKSGKDRTAMSVTLEQSNLLGKRHGLPENFAGEMTTRFRRAGVRRDNVMKNIRRPNYAFNRFQLAMLPKEFQSPSGTYGETVS